MYIDESGDTIPISQKGKSFLVLTGCIIYENEKNKSDNKIKSKDNSAITNALIRLLSDDNLRKRLMLGGLSSVNKFNWQDLILRIDNIYKEYGDKKNKLLIATGIYPPDIGGPATFAAKIADGFNKIGYKVQILTFCS